MKKLGKLFSILLIVGLMMGMSSCVTEFFHEDKLELISINVKLPGSSARAVYTQNDAVMYTILFESTEGNKVQEKSGKPGETVHFVLEDEGTYNIIVKAFDKKDEVIAEGSLTKDLKKSRDATTIKVVLTANEKLEVIVDVEIEWGNVSEDSLSVREFVSKISKVTAINYNENQSEKIVVSEDGKTVTLNGLKLYGNFSKTYRFPESLTNPDLRGLDTSNVTDMSYMFSGCKNLSYLDVSSLDTSNVTAMSNMFSGCNNLYNLDLAKFDTSKVTDMSYMFSGCNNLYNLILASFDTSKVTETANMFYDCGPGEYSALSIKYDSSKWTLETGKEVYGAKNLTWNM